MQADEEYRNERLDHLGIVAGVCREIGLDEAFTVAEQEVILIELATYRDRAHQDEVLRKLATDERSIMLYKKMLTVLDRKRQVYGEFEQVV